MADLFNPTVTQIDTSTAELIDGIGEAYIYTNEDGSGKYTAPAGTANALVKNANGTWTETQADGMVWQYDATGGLTKFTNPSGGRWTMLRSGSLLSAV